MTKRPSAGSHASAIEAGPVRISTAADMGTRAGAVVFTLLVAVGVMAAATNAQRLLPAALDARPAASAAPTVAPSPTPAPTAPAMSSLSSAWVGQSPYTAISVGGTTTVTITFRNTGTATWVRGTASEVRLGIVGAYEPSMAKGWAYPERPAVQREAVVAPNGLATFTFELQGARAGTFEFRLRPIVDGVGWLEDQGVFAQVEVRATP